VAAPQLAEQGPKNIAEALSIAAAQDWISDETAISELGYDPRLENKKLEREKAERQQSALQGRGVMPPPQQQLQPGGQPTSGWQVSAQLVPNPPNQLQPQAESEEDDEMRGLLALPRDLLLQVKEEYDKQDAEERRRLSMEADVAQQRGELADVLREIHRYTVRVQEAQADAMPPTIVVNVPEQPAPVVNVSIPKDAIKIVLPTQSEQMTVQRDSEGRISAIHKTVEA